MSYSKNPPWLATSTAATTPTLQAQMGLPNAMVSYQPTGQPVFTTISSQPQAPPPPNISLITMAAASVQQAPPNLYTQTVSYPAPRPINTIAYHPAPTHHQMQPVQVHPPQQQQQQPQMSPQMAPMQMSTVVSCPTVGGGVQSNLMATQRAYHGTVTKIQADVGFIDDEIFFHKSVVTKASMPKVGELVFVEASYASNTPFKWNASRVQVMQTQQAAPKANYNHNYPGASENDSYSRHSGGNSSSRHQSSHRSPRRSLDRGSKRESNRDSSVEHDRRRRSGRDEREPKRERRDYTPPLPVDRDRRERSPVSRSTRPALVPSNSLTRASLTPPPKKRRRVVPRYMVQIPKVCLKLTQADILELKQRYQNLYIPSDFFHAAIRWSEMFTPDQPYVLRQPCAFQLMHKEVAAPPELAQDESLIDPEDADYSFSARVMLMSVPPMADIYKQSFACAGEETEGDEVDRSLVHPSRLISFLVGQRNGKNETMAIGGPWSASLDGENPESDPAVLIRTAIRTCKALTGIDLSRCTQWYRFVELYYHRRETGRVNTVVVFMPDVRACVPTADEWLVLKGQYKMALQRVLDRNHTNSSTKASNSNAEGRDISNKGQKEAIDQDIDAEKKVEDETPATVPEEISKEAAATEATSTEETEKETTEPEKNGEQDQDAAMEAETSASDEQLPLDNPPDEKMEIAAEDDDKAEPKTANPDEAPDADDTAAVAVEEGTMNVDDEQQADDIMQRDIKAMKMPELKEALTAMNLPTKGLKADLVERLTEAMKKESDDKEEPQEVAINKDESINDEPVDNEIEPSKEESNHSLEEGMPDLENMTVIDEVCDPSKQQQQQQPKVEPKTSPAEIAIKSPSKEALETDKTKAPVNVTKEVKPLSEKDIRQLQRRYTLPDSPEIIVHPSRTAKGGKFDCSLMSLSVLLDYGLDDSKEHSFEVYLFAELFNEMLMRDFGYNIYRALHGLAEKKAVVDEEEQQQQENPKDAKEAKSTEKDNKEADGVSSAAVDNNKSKNKERKKQVTFNPELLLSFAYFDQTHCGYVLCKDLEDLLSTIGLSLSKDQIRKVVKRGALTDSLYYRKLTDKDKDDSGTIDDAPKEDQESVNAAAAVLAKGNAPLLPVFTTDIKISDEVAENSKPTATEAKETGLVVFNGALVNVEKLMERIKTAERALLDTEQVLVDVKRENLALTAANNKSMTKIKDLTTDLKSVSRKLGDSESTASSLQRKSSEYLSVLSSIQDKIAPILVKKERSSASSRNSDKEKEKDRESKVEVKAESGSSSNKTSTSKTSTTSAVPAEGETIKKEK